MSPQAAALRLDYFREHVAALNALVRAVERFSPTLVEPSYPAWTSSPSSFGDKREEPLTLEAAVSLGKAWENHASKLDDAVGEISFDDLRNELGGLEELAAKAREALLALSVYEPV